MMKKSSFIASALCVLSAMALFAMGVGVDSRRSEFDPPRSSDGSVVTPGGLDKKYVGLFFDVFNTTPSNILANADQFAKYTPYLDGVAIGITANVVDENGSVITAKHHQIMHRSQRWTREEIKKHLPYLKEIAKKPNLTESMLLFWMSPSGDNRITWDDDEGWANYAENMANVAWLAKEAGLKGLMLDPEEYAAQGGKFAQYIHCYKDPPFPETAKLARQRGREVFSRVFKEFPDAVIFSLWTFNKFRFWMEGGRQPFPLSNVEQSGELLTHFLNGMVDVMPPEVRVVEGSEQYSGSATQDAYKDSFISAATTAISLVAPENVAKYRSQFYFSNTHYFDMYRTNASPASLWYHGPVDGSRLEHMRLNFEQSYQVATKYVWLYGEGNGKLFNWRDGHYAKRKTWEELAPGMTETIMLVKNPLGLSAQRKSALAKEGKLVNLAKDFKGFVLEQKPGEREFHQSKKPVAKNLKPGERYGISLNIIERAAKKGEYRDGAAIPYAYWAKDGQPTSAKPIAIQIDRSAKRNDRGALPAELEVVVPDDANELVFDLGASLNLHERVTYWSLSVNNLLNPVNPPKVPAAKWVFDADKKTLSNGNWTLSATLNKKSGSLSVSGENENTTGSGVLDFTTVKADTGYIVNQIGKLKNIQSMSAFYGPDVVYARDGGLSHCSNITAVVTGAMRMPWWATTDMSKRLVSLKNLGINTAVPTGFRIFDHRHGLISRQNPPKEICIKGVKPGELYSVGLSMKRSGPGYVYLFAHARGEGKIIKPKMRSPQIVMPGPRLENKWQSGETLIRIPEGADELFLEVSTEITEGYSRVEIDDIKIYKIGEPLPVWPAEALREKGWRRK